jgi:uncharacterized Fe-S cluster protein YjdI
MGYKSMNYWYLLAICLHSKLCLTGNFIENGPFDKTSRHRIKMEMDE